MTAILIDRLPDGLENNKRLAKYTLAIAEIAKTNDVPFVDLFQPSQQLYTRATTPLTINGVHLTANGNEQIAKEIDQRLAPSEIAAK